MKTTYLSETQKILSQEFPSLSPQDINQIDRIIKRSIARDDEEKKIYGYVKHELSTKVRHRKSLQNIYRKVAKEYLRINCTWMFQENLFCFLSLIITIIWTITQLLSVCTQNNLTESNTFYFIIYLLGLIFFRLMNKFYQMKKKEKLELFLKILNRYSPSAIMLGTTIVYGALSANLHGMFLYAMIISALCLLLYAIIRTIQQIQ